ncbi:MAG TPA: FAD-dependent oxidoreductase [Acidimicrobiia bacterium]
MSRPPVAVVGGGWAGLVAACDFRRRGIPVVVLEASDQIGGLARTFRDGEGFSYDFGAHFITNRLADAVGIADQCLTVRHYGEAVVSGGRTYGYPFGLVRSPRFAGGAIRGRWRQAVSGDPAISIEELFVSQYGEPLARAILIPLVEAWSGARASELAASIADKIPSSILETMWLKGASRLTRRAVAIGYCREMPQSYRVWHVYPEGGLSVLFQKLAEALAGLVRLNSPVEAIHVSEDRVVGVRVGGKDEEVSAVFSTAPVHVLPGLIRGSSAFDGLSEFQYRPMTLVNLKMQGRGLVPEVVTWTPAADLPFFRVTEAAMSMPWLAPPGKTLITADLGCEVGDEVWTMDDGEVAELTLEGLQSLIPDARRRHLGHAVLRTPLAYPKFLLRYEAQRSSWEQASGVKGFVAIGRNGEFAHTLMEDVYWRTLRKVDRFARAHEDSVPGAAMASGSTA